MKQLGLINQKLPTPAPYIELNNHHSKDYLEYICIQWVTDFLWRV